MVFCAESSTRSPVEEMYSSVAMSMVRADTPSREAFSSFSSSGAVMVSSRPVRTTVSSVSWMFFVIFSIIFPPSVGFGHIENRLSYRHLISTEKNGCSYLVWCQRSILSAVIRLPGLPQSRTGQGRR